jgi:hypothetical protein
VNLKKQHSKAGSECEVTSPLSTESAGSARTAHVVGDFNNGDPSANLMKRLKDGNDQSEKNKEKEDWHERRLARGSAKKPSLGRPVDRF